MPLLTKAATVSGHAGASATLNQAAANNQTSKKFKDRI